MSIFLTSKPLSQEAKKLYYNLSSKYINTTKQAIHCRLTPNELDKSIKELEELGLIEIKVSIKKKK